MPWIETEEDSEFVEFVKTFTEKERPKILALLDKYREKRIIIFKTREEANAFLENDRQNSR